MAADSPGWPVKNATGAAFLLAQIGAHGSSRWAARIESLGLTPAQGGLLRAITAEPGRSQQALAEQLGIHPSRLVAHLDDLERAGTVERRRNAQDRRLYEIHLTDQGQAALSGLYKASAEHEADLCAALNDNERAKLAKLLRRIADDQGLTPGVHPGFRDLGTRNTEPPLHRGTPA